MELTLDEKQLLSSLSDLVVYKPEIAEYLFSQHDIKKFPYYRDLKGIITLINLYNHGDFHSDQYIFDLSSEIQKIQNAEIRSVFESSLNYANFN
ncbi:hypothetical protein LA366_14665 [Aeromonas jandaei]|uniref:Uncharacterized protein n=1 Tax=Aeromonas jandaei TaxID=650 RepID=A0A7T4DR77_AERJA|nr:hypothetical protein [Aeromonas jandaei]QQB21531.1 hypothetical protein I6H43_08440 [Aeromonas jandaei]UCA32349.1 hypothetical protein LA366_14665 [Aeromonas jandaei]